MSVKLDRFPRKDELVLGIVSKIQKHGIYIKLIEYENLEAYVHIGEIATAWIRNIRNYVRIDQQVVAKVLRSDSRTGHVDASLKRVSAQKKKEKNTEYRHRMSALAIIKLIAEKVGKSPQEVQAIIEPVFDEEFGSLYHGFEFIATEGEIDFESDLPTDIMEAIVEMAKASIKIQTYEKEVKIGLRSYSPNGVEEIRDILLSVADTMRGLDNIDFELYSVGSPTYRLFMTSKYFEYLDDASYKVKKVIEDRSKDYPQLEYSIKEPDTK